MLVIPTLETRLVPKGFPPFVGSGDEIGIPTVTV